MHEAVRMHHVVLAEDRPGSKIIAHGHGDTINPQLEHVSAPTAVGELKIECSSPMAG